MKISRLIISVCCIAAMSLLMLQASPSARMETVANGDRARPLAVGEGAASAASAEAAETIFPDIPQACELVAQTARLALHADMETGDFVLEDKEAGLIWHSVPPDFSDDKETKGVRRNQIRSLLLVDYVDMRTVATSAVPTTANSYGDSVRNGTVSVTRIDSGVRVVFTFEEEALVVPVEFTLRGDALCARIDGAGVREDSYNHIQTMHLLPGFMAAGTTAEGYLLLPDGSGATAELNNGKGSFAPFDRMIYGMDGALEQKTSPAVTRDIAMPVFGISLGNRALMGIVSQGDANAGVYANVSGPGIGYNRIYPKMIAAVTDSTTLFETDYFNVREIFRLEQRKVPGDFEVQYYALSGDKANYTGMAGVYRDYLLTNKLLTSSPKQPSLAINLYGAAEKQATFLGIPYQKLFAMTTFHQAGQVINSLTSQGVDRLTVRYSGWQNRGMQNKKIPNKAAPLNLLGGKKAWQSLCDLAGETGTTLYSDVDLVTVRQSGRSVSAFSDVSMSMFNVRVEKNSYLLSVGVTSLKTDPWYMVKPQRLEGLSNRYAASLDRLAAKEHGVVLNEIGKLLYSDFSKNGVTRAQAMDEYRLMAAQFGNRPVAVEYGNAYTYAYAEQLFSLPLTGSDFMIADESVPFAQIVLHGCLPFTGEDFNRATDSRKYLLKCLETGSDPYFAGMATDSSVLLETNLDHLYSSTASDWEYEAAAVYAAYREVHGTLYDQVITGHEKLADSVYKTEFSNGTAIYVNYGSSTFSADDVHIDALGYAVKEAA